MDLFVQHLGKIKAVALKVSLKFNKRFDVDELINASYILYQRAITNNPSLVDGQFSKLSTFLFRVKSDMLDYARAELGLRKKHLPVFVQMPMQTGDFFEPDNTEYGYEEIDNKDYLETLCTSATLTDDEWSIIQGYFYEDRYFKDIGDSIGLSESRVSVKEKEICKKLLQVSCNML